MRSIHFRIVLPFVLALGLTACASGSGGAGDGVVRNGDLLQGTGSVVWNPVEGGFYAIRGDDGTSYDPMNLAGEYHKSGLRIRFSARIRPDMAGIHMAGPIVEILSIERL